MTINVRAKGFDLLTGTHEAINENLEGLNKFLGVDADYRVSIKKRNHGEYETMISTNIRSKHFNIRVTRTGIRDSIEAAVKFLRDSVLESRDKKLTKKLNSAHNVEFDAVDNDENIHTEPVTRHKEVLLTPLNDTDAIEALNNSNHDMYMYLDDETLEVKGIYHREDGYGVITFKPAN